MMGKVLEFIAKEKWTVILLTASLAMLIYTQVTINQVEEDLQKQYLEQLTECYNRLGVEQSNDPWQGLYINIDDVDNPNATTYTKEELPNGS